MAFLGGLPLLDLRARMDVRETPPGMPNSRKWRSSAVIGTTVHYNGPALPFYPSPARELRFISEVIVPAHQQRLNADSIQYHFVVLSDGRICYVRDAGLEGWHSGNKTANTQTLAVMLIIGKGQEPRPAQVEALYRLLDALQQEFGYPREAVYGHNEWPRTRGAPRPSPTYRVMPPQSECPGPNVHHYVARYRAGATREVERWEALWRCPIRQAPRTHWEGGEEVPIAGWLAAGQEFEVDAIKDDGDAQEVRGDRRWLHLANGLGFVWLPNARPKT